MHCLIYVLSSVYIYVFLCSSFKLNDSKTIRRAEIAEIFKSYDPKMDGFVKVAMFSFMFRDLIQVKHVNGKLEFGTVVARLDPMDEGVIQLNTFISWLDTVRLLGYSCISCVVFIIYLCKMIVYGDYV